MADGSFRLIIRQGINVGKIYDFRKLAEEFTSCTQAEEPGTLGYEWFVNEDGSECYLNEYYRDSEAFLTHFASIGPKIGQMLTISPLLEAIVLGDPSAEVKRALSMLEPKYYMPVVGFCR
ncbi:MAG: hypothetical protein A2133_10005 [Actinobacteria bacterium RBG_16_64_13]|nr:MAG: hypothetical protein A2133_10005 [Actinobacteria bacterium RBG_16_64_13]